MFATFLFTIIFFNLKSICNSHIIGIMAATKRTATWRKLFKKFNILPLDSECLLTLLSFVVDNTEKFQSNSDIHSINTRYRYNLHVPNTNLSKYQKGVYYSGINLLY
jgi:hypothetical protein